MNILMFLIPVSMLFLGLAVWAFIWAVKGRQFDDLDASALDILREDEHDRPRPPAAATRGPPAGDGDGDGGDDDGNGASDSGDRGGGTA